MSAAVSMATDGVLAATVAVATVYGALVAFAAARYGLQKVLGLLGR